MKEEMKFDPKYKVYTWKNWMYLHWVLNPGLAINELIFGQRIPKINLEDTSSDKPKIERSYVPCPNCHEIHDARTWASKNGTAFKNWFGLYCHKCGEVIPCLTNVFSFIALAITYPIWGWFKNNLKETWLQKQPNRYQNLDIESIPNPYEGKGWIKQGLMFGLFMFIIMTFLWPLIDGTEINLQKVFIGIPIWTIAGLAFGYFNKKALMKKNKNQTL